MIRVAIAAGVFLGDMGNGYRSPSSNVSDILKLSRNGNAYDKIGSHHSHDYRLV